MAAGRLLATRALTTLALAAVALWAGGLLALGAFAAPAVFGNVPAPISGDAMVLAFRRFDRFALACAGATVLCEAALAYARKPMLRVDVARAVVAALMVALAVAEGAVISPRIAALHAMGAIRGVGTAGLELESVHELSKRAGSAVLVLAVLYVLMHVTRLTSRADGHDNRVP